jgi:hypothetical protein
MPVLAGNHEANGNATSFTLFLTCLSSLNSLTGCVDEVMPIWSVFVGSPELDLSGRVDIQQPTALETTEPPREWFDANTSGRPIVSRTSGLLAVERGRSKLSKLAVGAEASDLFEQPRLFDLLMMAIVGPLVAIEDYGGERRQVQDRSRAVGVHELAGADLPRPVIERLLGVIVLFTHCLNLRRVVLRIVAFQGRGAWTTESVA